MLVIVNLETRPNECFTRFGDVERSGKCVYSNDYNMALYRELQNFADGIQIKYDCHYLLDLMFLKHAGHVAYNVACSKVRPQKLLRKSHRDKRGAIFTITRLL